MKLSDDPKITRELHNLALKHKTDKAEGSHITQGHSYLDFYEPWLSKKRLEVKKFVEIGVKGGNSVRLWKEYFPQAQIFGIDIDPGAKVHEEERIKIIIGDQNNKDFLEKVKAEVGQFDMLLDDGSHIIKHMIHSFNVLWPNLKPGGVYIMEDLKATYEEAQNQHDVRKIWPGMEYNQEDDPLKNKRQDFRDFLEEHFKQMDFHHKTALKCVHYYPMTVVLEKLSHATNLTADHGWPSS